jgi:hypothetical protein
MILKNFSIGHEYYCSTVKATLGKERVDHGDKRTRGR